MPSRTEPRRDPGSTQPRRSSEPSRRYIELRGSEVARASSTTLSSPCSARVSSTAATLSTSWIPAARSSHWIRHGVRPTVHCPAARRRAAEPFGGRMDEGRSAAGTAPGGATSRAGEVDELLGYLERMTFIRRFEEEVQRQFQRARSRHDTPLQRPRGGQRRRRRRDAGRRRHRDDVPRPRPRAGARRRSHRRRRRARSAARSASTAAAAAR